MNTLFSVIDKYGKELADFGAVEKVVLKGSNGVCVETKSGVDFAKLTEADIVECSDTMECRILMADENRNAMVLAKTPYCMKAAEKGVPMTAALDDMAQIVGCTVYTVDDKEDEVKKVLEDAEGCFIRGRCAVVMGRSLYEAAVALEVLEKSAEVNLKAEVLGGICQIEAEEAAFMRKNYVEHYSRKEQEIKKKEGRE